MEAAPVVISKSHESYPPRKLNEIIDRNILTGSLYRELTGAAAAAYRTLFR